MPADPLTPATHRLPMNPVYIPIVHDQPTEARPFVLRGVAPSPGGGRPVVFRHRTEATKRKIEQSTGLDNQTVDDSYTVPDD